MVSGQKPGANPPPLSRPGGDAAATLRRVAASLLIASVGSAVLGFLSFVGTIFAYGVGVLFGVPVGFVAGGVLGWRMPLRDAVILCVSFWGGLVSGLALSARLIGDRSSEGFGMGALSVLIPVVAAVASPLFFLGGARLVYPFEKRRAVALGFAVAAALFVLYKVWYFAFVFEPGSKAW